MEFLNYIQEQNYYTLRHALAPKYRNDNERVSLLYLMAGNDELAGKLNQYYDQETGYFEYEDVIKNEDLSSTTRVLVDLAWSLLTGSDACKVTDFTGFKGELLQLVLHAIQLRYDKRDLYAAEDGNQYLK